MNSTPWPRAVAELLGALAIVLFGCGAVAVSETLGPPELVAWAPLIFGATVAMMIYALGHVSGAHFNPAVTLALALAGRFSWKEVPLYIVAQILGGVLGCVLIFLFVPETQTYGATVMSISPMAALGVEAVLTFFLVLVIISMATDDRAARPLAGLAIGLTVMVGSTFGGPLTGASMNPARSIGPALFQNELGGLEIYLLGPLLGGAMAAFLYEFLRGEISH